MAATAKYVPNQTGISALGRTTEMGAALKVLAEAAAHAAQELAPFDEGDYREGIETEVGIEGPTVIARINANDWKSGLIEFGTGVPGPTPTFAPLRRGAEAVGLDVKAK